MVLKSKVGRTVSGSGESSLRCSVPKGVAAWLGVKQGDYLFWHMKTINNRRIVAIVTTEEKDV